MVATSKFRETSQTIYILHIKAQIEECTNYYSNIENKIVVVTIGWYQNNDKICKNITQMTLYIEELCKTENWGEKQCKKKKANWKEE